MFQYIPTDNLKSLDNYKYVGIDRSLVANYIMQPFWRWVVNFLPTFMAPNLVTLVGFVFILISYLTLACYCPTMEDDAPPWVYIFCGASVFAYQTLDAIDGKQARKTFTSSALGELFDHGCDAITTVLLAAEVSCILHLGTGWIFFINTMILLSSLFLTIWDLYFTSQFDLGIVNVTEALLATVGMNIAAAFDPKFFEKDVDVFGYPVKLSTFVVGISTMGTFYTSVSSVLRVLKTPSVKDKTLALIYTTPFLTILVGGTAWVILSPSNIIAHSPHLFIVTLGWINAYCVGRLMVQRLCLMEPQVFYYILLPIPLAIINCFVKLVDEQHFLIAFFCISFLFWLHFILSIIQVFCAKLNINCLTMTEAQKQRIISMKEKEEHKQL